jgi:hypothetical protein
MLTLSIAAENVGAFQPVSSPLNLAQRLHMIRRKGLSPSPMSLHRLHRCAMSTEIDGLQKKRLV